MIHGQRRFMATAVCAISAFAAADTINVPVDHPTIQAAIDAAVDGDTVMVAPGTYNEAINFNGKSITVRSSDGADVTTISAKGLDTSVVTFASGESFGSILSRFTVTDGAGTLGQFNQKLGGGIYCLNTSPTITYCILTGNSCNSGGGLYVSDGSPELFLCDFISNTAQNGYGGGLYAAGGEPWVHACTFENNCSWSNGGGIYATSSPLDISYCSFVDNVALHSCSAGLSDGIASGSPSGGGLYFEGADVGVSNSTFIGNQALFMGGAAGFSGSGTFVNCLFQSNSGPYVGGAISMFLNSHLVLNRCTFLANSAGSGGAIGVSGSTGTTLSITNCLFEGNIALDEYDGGGALSFLRPVTSVTNCVFRNNIAARGGAVLAGDLGAGTITPTFLNCIFSGNSATGTHAGNGIPGGGAAFFRPGIDPQMTNCLFFDNVANVGPGGALIIGGLEYGGLGSNPTLVNCTIADNSAPIGGAGAIFIGAPDDSSSNPTLANCIVWDNGIDPIVTHTGSTTTITFSDVQGGFAGAGNLDGDPLFADPGSQHYTLQFGSMCIDAGDNTAIPAGVTSDLADNPRIINTIVDMGAYESPADLCVADFFPPDGDGIVNTADLIQIINNWGPCPSPPFSCPADIAPPRGDGVVNTGDLLMLLNNWGPCL